ncbi:MAG: YdcF family protein [Chloroflexi bacterium]|nr:MAG: YdcF family protein [Chloroflexota bacterium]MBL1196409.1 YdcF family protein [Chloroflexota bacterium]NOH13704.1 YdcF family protein [Chloroflexota bacterium]
MKWFWRVIVAVSILGTLVIAYIAVDIYRFSLQDQTQPADAAIVLGAAVWEDEPSPVFRERINHAIGLYFRGTVSAIIFTGGRSSEDLLSEAEAAKNYAVEHGVPADIIFIEVESTITFENLSFASQIVEQEGFGTVLLVSDPLHMKRAMMMAADLGLEVYSSPTPTSLYQSVRTRGEFLIREVYFLISYDLQS